VDDRTFRAELQKLQRAAADRGNPGCFEVHESANSTQCQFSTGLKDCHRCSYTTASTACTHSTHLTRCTQCHQSSNLVDCLRCVESHYLTQCTDCVECTYCYGCVGLVRKEFHFLNQPYDKKTWFQLVKQLQATAPKP
jgi:hypothetical protein